MSFDSFVRTRAEEEERAHDDGSSDGARVQEAHLEERRGVEGWVGSVEKKGKKKRRWPSRVKSEGERWTER